MKPENAAKIKYGLWGLICGGSDRHNHRLCVGWLDNLRHEPNEDQRGSLGESGGDLRRPIYEATEP